MNSTSSQLSLSPRTNHILSENDRDEDNDNDNENQIDLAVAVAVAVGRHENEIVDDIGKGSRGGDHFKDTSEVDENASDHDDEHVMDASRMVAKTETSRCMTILFLSLSPFSPVVFYFQTNTKSVCAVSK